MRIYLPHSHISPKHCPLPLIRPRAARYSWGWTPISTIPYGILPHISTPRILDLCYRPARTTSTCHPRRTQEGPERSRCQTKEPRYSYSCLHVNSPLRHRSFEEEQEQTRFFTPRMRLLSISRTYIRSMPSKDARGSKTRNRIIEKQS